MAPQYGRDSLAAELVSLQTCGFTTTTLAITLEALAEDAAARQAEDAPASRLSLAGCDWPSCGRATANDKVVIHDRVDRLCILRSP